MAPGGGLLRPLLLLSAGTHTIMREIHSRSARQRGPVWWREVIAAVRSCLMYQMQIPRPAYSASFILWGSISALVGVAFNVIAYV